MAIQMLPQDVADAFVKQYYTILNKCPHNLHKFYQESSLVGWQGSDGDVTPVTTLSGINDKVMSSDFKNWCVEIKSADAQESTGGAVLVVVTGSVKGEDVKKNFSQTFFLAKQEKGFFVLNDVLRFFDIFESINEVVDNDDVVVDGEAASISVEDSGRITSPSVEGNSGGITSPPVGENSGGITSPPVGENSGGITSPPVEQNSGGITSPPVGENSGGVTSPPVENSVPSDISDSQASSPTKAEAKHENPKETREISVSKDAEAKVAAPKSPVASREKVQPVVISVSKVKEDSRKLSYASMVVKESPQTSPKKARVPTNADNQAVAPPTAKASAPIGDGVPKVATPSGAVSKPSAPPSNVAPKLPMCGNGTQSAGSHADARGIYIGRLPYDITKQGVLEVVKKFGTVRRSSDSIQIRRHEDGFCCGFVEFESADSARRAVEAHHVKFGERESYITYKRSSNRGHDGRGRSPTRVGSRTGNFRGRENGEVSNDGRFQNENRSGFRKVQGRSSRRQRPFEQWTSDEGEDGQGWSN